MTTVSGGTPEGAPYNMRRADLHVHSYHSTENGNMPFLRSRDCYSPPDEVYRVAKARGMDFVTITDHDSVGGCLEFLDRHPDTRDFIVGEEVSCRLPDGNIEVHLGVYGTSAALHRELQPLRKNVFEVTALLRERRVFFVLNHLLHFYREQIPLASYLRLLAEVPALEARNGTLQSPHNALIEQIARGDVAGPVPVGRRWTTIGGSDAHTLRRVGTTWTEADGETPEAFLASLAAGRAHVGGVHGGVGAITGDVYGVIGRYVGSLLGVGPQDHGALERTLCLAFSAASLPLQFIPALIALATTRQQARTLARAIEELSRHPIKPPQRGRRAGDPGKGCPTYEGEGCPTYVGEARPTNEVAGLPADVGDIGTADHRSPTADSRQPTADSRPPIADSRQPTADSRQLTAESPPPRPAGPLWRDHAAARESPERAEAGRQPTAESRQPTAEVSQ